MARYLVLALLATIVFNPQSRADDWEQWRGKDRLGVWEETGILEKFPESGLDVTWRVEIGSGYSAPVVSKGKVVTMDYFPDPDPTSGVALERVICLDENSGELVWKHELKTDYREVMGSYRTGPRAAPTIDGDRVYVVGSVGDIRCLNLDSGELLWSKNSRELYDLVTPVWGTSIAPIVDGDLVIFAPGGQQTEQVRAYNKMTGEEVWSACPANHELAYSQFALFTHAGVKQLMYWDELYLRSLNPQTGEVYWEVPMNLRSHMAIATPVKSGNKILVSSFYNGSMLVELDDDKPAAKKLWHVQGSGEKENQTKGLHCVITTPIIEGDYFYGTCSYGELRGLELATSNRLWVNKELTRQGRWGSAYFVAHEDKYFMFNDVGELLIVRFSPSGVEVIDRTKLIEPDTQSGFGPRRFANSVVNWVHPSFANKHVIVRNDHEILRASLAK